jgi:hypothetical protein
LGNIPISYFNDYSATNVPNAPYTLQFSRGLAYNVGTQYLLGRMATATETLNTFSIPIVGGAGPCPNGAMRSGQLQVTCSAAATSFSVNENPMCTYDMYFSTTQACPPGTVFPSPPPPPPSPSPPPPTVYTSRKVNIGSQQFTDKVTGGPTAHVLNGGATSSSTETTADGKVHQYATTTTTDATQAGSGNGHVNAMSTSTTTSDVSHPQTFLKHNAPPPAVYTSTHVRDAANSLAFSGRVEGTNHNSRNNGQTTSTTDSTASGNVNVWLTTSTTDTTQRGSGNGNNVGQSTTTDTTATGNVVQQVTHHTHPSTTDLDATSVEVTPSSAAPPLCSGAPFAVENQQKNLCLHVKGALAPGGGFALAANIKRPVITMKCVAGSPNQLFSWLPGAAGAGQLQHDATGMLLSVNLGNGAEMRDGAMVTVLPAAAGGAPTQAWVWSNPTSGGGTLSSAADTQFQVTDALVNAGANIGLPVHLWHLSSSLPSGAPNGAWMAGCSA